MGLVKICRPAGDSSGDEEYDEFGTLKPEKPKYYTKPLPPVKIDYQVELDREANAGNLEGVINALDNGAVLGEALPGCYTALMAACFGGYPQIAKKLLELGADPNCRKQELITPLMTTCFSHCNDENKLLECLNLLIAYDAHINTTDKHGLTSLMYACKYNREDLVIELLKNNANINLRDSQGWSALFWAVNTRNERLVDMLVSGGAKKKIKDHEGRTPFDLAASRNDLKGIAESLCPRKLRAEFLNRDRKTYVVREEYTEATYYAQILAKIKELSVDDSLPRKFVKGQKISFYTFLSVTDDELQDLGVHLSWHRRITLDFIHHYHCKSWLGQWANIPSKSILNYRQATNLMLDLAAQMSILNSTLIYIERVLATTPIGLKPSGRLTTLIKRNELGMRRLYNALDDLKKNTDRFDPTIIFSSDYIMPPKKKKPFECLTSFVMIVCLSTIAVYAKRKLF